MHFTFSIKLKDDKKINIFLENLESIDSVEKVDLLSTRNDIEY